MARGGGEGLPKLTPEQYKAAQVAEQSKQKEQEAAQKTAEAQKTEAEKKEGEKKPESKDDKKGDKKKDDKSTKGKESDENKPAEGPKTGGYRENPRNPGDDVDYVEKKPGEKREKVPFWRTIRNYFNGGRNAPKVETDFLDREKNYSKPEEIRSLVDGVLHFDFEINMRNKRYKELYGSQFGLGRLRAWLTGDGRWVVNTNEQGERQLALVGSDFQYTETTDQNGRLHGNLRHQWWNELARKGTNVTLKTLRTAVPGILLSAFTGGVGAAFIPALAGSFGARGVVEAIRSATSQERELKEKAEITRIRYFQKARELAQRINDMPEEYDQAQTNKTPEQYEEERKERVIDLLNFIYSYEELSTEVEYDDHGRPIIDTRTETREGQIIDGREPGNADRETSAYVKGTEVTQPSPVSPDAVKVKDLETELEKKRHNWDRISEYGALIGGLAAGAWFTLRGGWSEMTKTAYDQMHQKLGNGEVVNLNIDGDMKWHGVQKAGELANRLHDQYIYHYKSIGEMLSAQAHGAHPVAEVGKYGAHELFQRGTDAAANMLRLNQAIYQQSIYQVSGQLAKIASALGVSWLVGMFSERGNSQLMDKYRHELKHNYEQRRKRNLPETEKDLIDYAKKEHLVYPMPDVHWVREVSPGVFVRIIVHDVIDGDVLASVDDPNQDFNEVVRIPIKELWREWRPVVKKDQKSVLTRTSSQPETEKGGKKGEGSQEKDTEKEKWEGDLEHEGKNLGNYEFGAEHRTRSGKRSNETYLFKEARTNEQMMISITNKNEKNELKINRLKEIADMVRSEYSSLTDVSPQVMEARLREISETVQSDLLEQNINDISWTLVVTTNEGKYFGFRFNDNQCQVYKTESDGKIFINSQRKNKDEKVYKNINYFYGELEEGESLALLDESLTSARYKNPETNEEIKIYEIRNQILANKSLTSEQKAALLVEMGTKNLPNFSEFNAIVAKYSKEPVKKPEPDETNNIVEKKETIEKATATISFQENEDSPVETKEIPIRLGQVFIQKRMLSGRETRTAWILGFDQDSGKYAFIPFYPEAGKAVRLDEEKQLVSNAAEIQKFLSSTETKLIADSLDKAIELFDQANSTETGKKKLMN